MTTTGTVTKCVSDPQGFTVTTAPGPPPVTVVFTPVSDAQYQTALAAYTKGSEVDVDGTPPACTKVTAR